MASRSACAPRSDNPATYFRRTRPFFVVVIVAAMVYYGYTVNLVCEDGKVIEKGTDRNNKANSKVRIDQKRKKLYNLCQFSLKQDQILDIEVEASNVGMLRYLAACLFHIGEAFLSIWLCNKKGITDSKTQLCWFIQTLLCGIASLYFLLVYKPHKKTQ
ncbi:hypothetical protein Chor_013713 [Crotalus horridus]